jgi:type II restriction enzyme
VTSLRATCEGFLWQALEKSRQAQHYVAEAKRFLALLEKTDNAGDLAEVENLQADLITAASFSEKAVKILRQQNELRDALRRWLEIMHAEHPSDWKDEMLYRYLLTSGGSLVGRMNNIIGAEAATKLVQAILTALEARNLPCKLSSSDKGKRRDREKVQKMRWHGRLLVFDKKPKFINNSVDALLLDDTVRHDSERQQLESPSVYLACGELKGGIDPQGADEHWKTALTALDRIREKFEPLKPKIFFVGAAIERAMAVQLFERLEDDRLSYAANLTSPAQLADLATWLVSL